MLKFILSVVSPLRTLLKIPTWLLWKVISIFFGQKRPPPPQIPSSESYSLSDLPYEFSSEEVCEICCQTSVPLQHPAVDEDFSRRSSHSPHRRRRARPYIYTLPTPHDVSAAEPTEYIQPATTSGLEVVVAPEVVAVPEAEVIVVPEAKVVASSKVDVVPEGIDPLSHETPESLRRKARCEGDLMEECFHRSREEFADGNKRRAKELSLEGEMHKRNMSRLDEEACAKIFQENNRDAKPNTVDLHRLYVTEAEYYFKDAVQNVWESSNGQPLCVIVGRGNHSDDNIPRIKPAIQALGESLGLAVHVDPENDGRLIVDYPT